MTTFYVILFLSWFSHFALTVSTAAKKHKKNFSFIVWFKNTVNLFYFISSLLIAVAIALSVNVDITKEINLSIISFKIGYIAAIVIGYIPTSIIRKIIKLTFKNK